MHLCSRGYHSIIVIFKTLEIVSTYILSLFTNLLNSLCSAVHQTHLTTKTAVYVGAGGVCMGGSPADMAQRFRALLLFHETWVAFAAPT